MPTFTQATTVNRVDEDIFTADIDPSTFVTRGPNGGFVAGIILRALLRRLDDAARPPRSLTTHFLAAPSAGPATILTSLDRRGRSVAFLSARMIQEDELVAHALAAFSPPWVGPIFTQSMMPSVPRVHSLEAPDAEAPPRLPFLAHWDERPVPTTDDISVGGWIRRADGGPLDAVAITAITDAWTPSIFPHLSGPAWAPTLDLTVHFRHPLPPTGVASDDFLLSTFRSRACADGFFEEDGDIWTPDGTLLAHSRQLALVMGL